MEDHSRGEGKPDIADIIVELPPKQPEIPSRVLADLIQAGRRATIKIKSKEDYDAVVATYGNENPMDWRIIHDPALGHHTMVYYNRDCC